MRSSRSSSLLGAALLATLALAPAPAHAEPASPVAKAEAAYREVDFEATRTAAREALAAGGNAPADTLRLYTLLGIAAAALGEDATARAAFRRVLAVEPRSHLDKSLSPKIRAPYLEVRGELTSAGELTPLSARLTHHAEELRFELHDPVGVAHAATLAYRTDHVRPFIRTKLEHDREAVARVTPAVERVEYVLALEDEHANALFRLGSEQAPEILTLVARDYGLDVPVASAHDASGYYWTAGVLAAAGLAAGGAGVYFNVRREAAAREWNGAACERPVGTRAEQCSAVDERRSQNQSLAIGLYAGGGALLVGGLVTWLVAPSAPERPAGRASLGCTPGALPLGAVCSVRF